MTERNVLHHWQDREDDELKYKHWRQMTLAEAGKQMGISKSRAQELERKALFKLWEGVWTDPELMAMWERTFK
jgi:DNA-directed RNA polymerase sigma subunit (sigma70/sigma32)